MGERTLPVWEQALDTRDQKQVELSRIYARDFAHGAPGHLDLMLIAKLAKLLDEHEMHEQGGA